MALVTSTVRGTDGELHPVLLDLITGQVYEIPAMKIFLGAVDSNDGPVNSLNPMPVSVSGSALPSGAATETTLVSVLAQLVAGLSVSVSSYSVDAFGRFRVSDTGQRFDVEFINDKQPLLIDEVTSGGGTAVHNSNTRDVTLSVVDANNGTQAALYGHYDVPYTAGNSQLIDITGTLDDADIGGGTAYVFLRTKISGTVEEETYAQVDWDAATSGVDWTRSHILQIDFQSLKVGGITFRLVRNKVPVDIKSIFNDNIRDSGYWQSPTLPAYWRIYNDATYSYMEMGYGDTENGVGIRYRISANASAKMRAICATVKSEGGRSLLDMPGLPFSADRAVSAKTVSNSLVPILSLRVASTINSIANRGLHIPESVTVTADNPIRFVILYRPTLTNASWTAVNATHSGMEYDVSATAVSGGVVVFSDYFATGKNTFGKDAGFLGRVLMSLGRTGTSDILTLAAIRSTGTDASTLAAVRWREIR